MTSHHVHASVGETVAGSRKGGAFSHSHSGSSKHSMHHIDMATLSEKDGTLHGRSLFIFGPSNPIRLKAYQIGINKYWTGFVLVSIVLNALFMGMADYSNVTVDYELEPQGSWRNLLLLYTDPVFLGIFALEMVLKVIVEGFLFNGENSYLMDGWNCLDFAVVTGGLIETLPFKSLKVGFLRTLRVLRPLRTMSQFTGMRTLVTALLGSVTALGNVILLLMVVFLIFGITAIQLWGLGGAQYRRCRLTEFPVKIPIGSTFAFDQTLLAVDSTRCLDGTPNDSSEWNKDSSPWATPQSCTWPYDPSISRLCGESGYTCPTGTFCGSNFDAFGNPRFEGSKIMAEPIFVEDFNWGFTNFDNILASMLTLFQAVTMEGWTDIMYMVMDGFNYTIAVVFFLLLLFIGAFFMLNLTLAIIWEQFESEQEAQQAEEAVEIAKHGRVVRKKSAVGAAVEEVSWLQWHQPVVKALVTQKRFDNFILMAIIFNTVILSLVAYPQDEERESQLELVNFFLTLIFLVEMLLRMVGLGLLEYLSDSFHFLDMVVVLSSIIELAAAPPTFMGGRSTSTGGALTVLRTFRLFRVLKVMTTITSLRRLLATILKTIASVANFALLLGLFMYIFALLGQQLLSNRLHFDPSTGYALALDDPGFSHVACPSVDPSVPCNDIPRSNYDDVLAAFTTVFQALSGEDWNVLMYDARRARCWGTSGVLFLLTVICFGDFMVMNLFLAVLLGGFGDDDEDEGKENENGEGEGEREGEGEEGEACGDSADGDAAAAAGAGAGAGGDGGQQAEEHEDESDKRRLSESASTSTSTSTSASPAYRLHGRSCSCLGTRSPLRIKLASIVYHPRFDTAILLLILVSSIALAVDNPLINPDSNLALGLKVFDMVITGIFLMEMLLKIAVMGLACQKDAYLNSNWNKLDCFIVCAALLGILSDNVKAEGVISESLNSVRSIRCLRTLRPLRVISRHPGMKLIVNAFFQAIPGVANVLVICLLFFLIFAIVFVNFFRGTFSHCAGDGWDALSVAQRKLVITPVPYADLSAEMQSWKTGAYTGVTSRAVCEWFIGSDAWQPVMPSNFDNVPNAMLTLFEMSTTEGWVGVMHATIDATGIEMQPVRDHAPAWSLLSMAFIVAGAYFMVNLFVGVIVDNFDRLKQKQNSSIFATDAQKSWLEARKTMMRFKPALYMKPPQHWIRRALYDIVQEEGPKQTAFEMSIVACIVVNIGIMASVHFGQSDEWAATAETINVVFALLFTVEMVVKVLAMGFVAYWSDKWNKFDLFVVVSSLTGILIKLVAGVGSGTVTTVFRALRTGRIMRLMKSLSGLRTLFNAVLLTLPGLLNVSVLLLLMYFIFAIMGMQLFATVKLGESLSEHANFQTFQSALLTLVRCSTGEFWNGIMYDLAITDDCESKRVYDAGMCGYSTAADCVPIDGCGSKLASYTFFLLFSLLVSFVFINLFIGVVIDGFEESVAEETARKSDDVALSDIQWARFCKQWVCIDRKLVFAIDEGGIAQLLQVLDFLRLTDGDGDGGDGDGDGDASASADADALGERFIADFQLEPSENIGGRCLYSFEDVALAAGKRAFQNHYIRNKDDSAVQGKALAEIGDMGHKNYLAHLDELWEIRKHDHIKRLEKQLGKIQKRQDRKEGRARRKTQAGTAAADIEKEDQEQAQAITPNSSKFVV